MYGFDEGFEQYGLSPIEQLIKDMVEPPCQDVCDDGYVDLFNAKNNVQQKDELSIENCEQMVKTLVEETNQSGAINTKVSNCCWRREESNKIINIYLKCRDNVDYKDRVKIRINAFRVVSSYSDEYLPHVYVFDYDELDPYCGIGHIPNEMRALK